jgi:hypothetical protein
LEKNQLTHFIRNYKKEKEEAKRKRKLEEECRSKLSKEKGCDEKPVQEDEEMKSWEVIKCKLDNSLIINTVEAT